MQLATSTADVELALAQAAQLLARQFAPERILLFGSRSRGTAMAGSDADLLVIVSDDTFSRSLAVEMRRALRGLPLALDLVVVPESVMARKSGVRGTIYADAAREGRELYAAH